MFCYGGLFDGFLLQALFIGQTYIDVTLLTEALPHGDDKAVAKDYAISFGGNAVTAAFACAKLGTKTKSSILRAPAMFSTALI